MQGSLIRCNVLGKRLYNTTEYSVCVISSKGKERRQYLQVTQKQQVTLRTHNTKQI